MRVSTHKKSLMVGHLDRLTGFGVKLGGAALFLIGIFLLISVFGSHLRDFAKLGAQDRAYMAQTIDIVVRAFVYAAIAVVASVIYRLFRDEVVGQSLA